MSVFFITMMCLAFVMFVDVFKIIYNLEQRYKKNKVKEIKNRTDDGKAITNYTSTFQNFEKDIAAINRIFSDKLVKSPIKKDKYAPEIAPKNELEAFLVMERRVDSLGNDCNIKVRPRKKNIFKDKRDLSNVLYYLYSFNYSSRAIRSNSIIKNSRETYQYCQDIISQYKNSQDNTVLCYVNLIEDCIIDLGNLTYNSVSYCSTATDAILNNFNGKLEVLIKRIHDIENNLKTIKNEHLDISSPPTSLHSSSSPMAKTLVSIKAITDKLTEHQSEVNPALLAKAKTLSSNVTELMSLYTMTDDKDLHSEILNQLVIINDTLADDLDAAKLPGTDSYVMEKLKINKIYLESAKNT